MKSRSFVQSHSLVSRLVLLLFSFSPAIASAQTGEDDTRTLSPYFVVLSENPETDKLPLKETTADVNIVGVIADVTVRQVYVNAGMNKLEAIYTFPLSTRAAVYAMEMKVGSRILTAKIEEKKKAKQDYEKAKKEGKRASLLEQHRPNVFTMNVANITSGDTITVELKYTELLVPEGGKYSFVYPTVVGPRYSNRTEGNAGSEQFVKAPYTKEGVMPAYKFGFTASIRSGLPIQHVASSTHEVLVDYPDLKTALLKLDDSESNGGNRDVIVDYSLQGDKIESGLMLYEDGEESFFLMMIQPPKKVLREHIPPREYIFIVDVSGSMHGFPIDISKKLLRNLIVNLKPDDKFNVLLFAGTSATLSPVSLDASIENFQKAVRFIDAQRGGGGTELLPAMEAAYRLPRADENISRSYVIVSDGYVSIEKEAFDFIQRNNGNTNFFSFGIGSSVNRYLMEGLAFMGRGEAMIVTKPQVAELQAEKFRNYINTPVLTHIKTNFGSFAAYDVQPSNSPDMLAERPIIVFGKYSGKANGTITLKGKSGRQNYSKTIDVSGVRPSASNSALKYLWAREKIKLLEYYASGYNREMDPKSPAAEILALGLKYNLMTNYTSFIAIDEELVADKDGKLIRVQQPSPLPQGVSNYAVGYEMDEVRAMNARSMPELSRHEEVLLTDDAVVVDSIFHSADVMPEFPGGNDSLRSFLIRNIKYPESAWKNSISGTVYVSFVVDDEGYITDVKITRGVDAELDKEALRVMKLMPRWKPGRQGGKSVNVRMMLPVKFSLDK